jgi:hypothetical protein
MLIRPILPGRLCPMTNDTLMGIAADRADDIGDRYGI